MSRISSTCIRERLLNGKVEELPDFLGAPYEVQCDWDGATLAPHPYYTLPAPGVYAVTVKKGMRLLALEMTVTEAHSLKSKTPLPFSLKGKLSIIWHRRKHWGSPGKQGDGSSVSLKFTNLGREGEVPILSSNLSV